MTYSFAKYALERFPRTTRAVIAVGSATAAVIALFLNGPLPARILGAAFYGVVAWLALAALHDLFFGARLGGPTRFPLPGLWRIRFRGDHDTPTVVVPLHLDAPDNAKVRVCALGAVFLAMGAYLVPSVRHTAHPTGAVVGVVICLLLAVICVGGTAPDLYRKAATRHTLELSQAGVQYADGGFVRWDEIAHVELVREPMHRAHGRTGPMRRYLRVTAQHTHAGNLQVDVTGVTSARGLVAIIDYYWHDPQARDTIGTRSSLWHIRLLRRSWRKTTTRPNLRGSSRVER
jgi:predicted membrane channel-forming protein YqfA (hemolysin III family)